MVYDANEPLPAWVREGEVEPKTLLRKPSQLEVTLRLLVVLATVVTGRAINTANQVPSTPEQTNLTQAVTLALSEYLHDVAEDMDQQEPNLFRNIHQHIQEVLDLINGGEPTTAEDANSLLDQIESALRELDPLMNESQADANFVEEMLLELNTFLLNNTTDGAVTDLLRQIAAIREAVTEERDFSKGMWGAANRMVAELQQKLQDADLAGFTQSLLLLRQYAMSSDPLYRGADETDADVSAKYLNLATSIRQFLQLVNELNAKNGAENIVNLVMLLTIFTTIMTSVVNMQAVFHRRKIKRKNQAEKPKNDPEEADERLAMNTAGEPVNEAMMETARRAYQASSRLNDE